MREQRALACCTVFVIFVNCDGFASGSIWLTHCVYHICAQLAINQKILPLRTLTSVVALLLLMQQVGFHRPGSIRLLTDQDRVDEAMYQLQRQGWHQSPMTIVPPEKIQEMVPMMKHDDIVGGLFTPGMYNMQQLCSGVCYSRKISVKNIICSIASIHISTACTLDLTFLEIFNTLFFIKIPDYSLSLSILTCLRF